MGVVFNFFVNLFQSIMQLIAIHIEIKRLLNKNPKLTKKQAMLIAKNKISARSQETKHRAKKIRKKTVRARIVLLSILMSVLMLISALIVVVSAIIQMMSLASSIAAWVNNDDNDSIVLYYNEDGAVCNDGNTSIALDYNKIQANTIKFDGTYRLDITFKSNSTTMSETKFVLKTEKEDNVGEATASIQKNESTATLTLFSNSSVIKEQRSYITGSNWVITKVILNKSSSQDKNFSNKVNTSKDEQQSNSGNGIGLCTDPVMRNWQLYLQYATDASIKANSEYGAGWVVIGSVERESVNDWNTNLNNPSFDIRNDLDGGHNDMGFGNIYTEQPPNNFEHVYGAPQFKGATWLSNCVKFEDGEHYEPYIDEEYSFIRPNLFFIPDAITTSAIYHSIEVSVYQKMKKLNGFEDLAGLDKQFIYGLLTQLKYARGHNEDIDLEIAQSLITVVNSHENGINNLVDMLSAVGKQEQYYAFMQEFNGWGIGNWVQGTFGNVSNFDGYSISYMDKEHEEKMYIASILTSLCTGYYSYTGIQAQVDAAEKEKGNDVGDASVKLQYTDLDDNGTIKEITIDLSDCNDDYNGTNYIRFSQWGWDGHQESCLTFDETASGNARIGTMRWGSGDDYSLGSGDYASYHTLYNDGCAIYALANATSNIMKQYIPPVKILVDLGATLVKKDNQMFIDTAGCSIITGKRLVYRDSTQKTADYYGFGKTDDVNDLRPETVFFYTYIVDGQIAGFQHSWHYVTGLVSTGETNWALFGEGKTDGIPSFDPNDYSSKDTSYNCFLYR